LVLICCGSIYICGATAERWLPTVIVNTIHPREPWPLAEEPVWANDLDNVISTAPVIADGKVYAETNNGLTAMDLQTGAVKRKGRFNLNNGNPSLAAGGEMVAVGLSNGVLVLSGDTGKRVWHYNSPFAFPVSIIIDQDRLYVWFAFKEVCAFDLHSGENLWCSREPGKHHSFRRMVLANSHLILVQSGRVYSFVMWPVKVQKISRLD